MKRFVILMTLFLTSSCMTGKKYAAKEASAIWSLASAPSVFCSIVGADDELYCYCRCMTPTTLTNADDADCGEGFESGHSEDITECENYGGFHLEKTLQIREVLKYINDYLGNHNGRVNHGRSSRDRAN